MIVTCPVCKKKFNIDINLIPSDGRNLQCGSCEHVWYYKKDNLTLEASQIDHDNNFESNNNINQSKNNEFNNEEKKQPNNVDKIQKTKLSKTNDSKSISTVTKKKQGSKFFSYLLVFIISLVALFILLDTLKIPLIDVFPGLEVLLFNLYETLKDIKLFIIDLS